MKVIKYFGKEDVRLVEIPTPNPGDGDVLIKVKAASLCASDMKLYLGIKKAQSGITLGHEVSGEIYKVGKKVRGFKERERVTIFPSASCGECYYCKKGYPHLCFSKESIGYRIDGGFAEYLLLPERFVREGNIYSLPNISFEVGALVEPLSTVISSIEMAGVEKEERIAIFGAGSMGLMHLILLKFAYNPALLFVIEPLSERRKIALELGADYTMIPGIHIVEDILSLSDRIGVDRVFICHGDVRAIELAVRSIRKRGVINLFASFKEGANFLVNPNTLHYGEIILTGTHSTTKKHFEKALNFLEKGLNLSPIITHRFILDEFEKGFKTYSQKEGLKVVFTP